MCSSFISADKCISTIYLFKKVITELEKQPKSKRYLKDYEDFVKLHFERLLYTKNKVTINQFVDAIKVTYPNLAIKMKRVQYLVNDRMDGHLNQARMHFYLFWAFGRKLNITMCVHELGKWILLR